MNTETTNKEKLQIVTFEQAKRLKEIDFDWKVYHWYNSDGSLSNSLEPFNRNVDKSSIAAPNIPLALKWIHLERGYYGNVNIYNHIGVPTYQYFFIKIIEDFSEEGEHKYSEPSFKDAYECESALLDDFLDI
jgi:hypothetical protein